MEKPKKPRLNFQPQFGVLAAPLVEQLKNAGVNFNERDEFLAQFQQDDRSITYLMGRGLLTFDQRDQMRAKLKGKIIEYLEKG